MRFDRRHMNRGDSFSPGIRDEERLSCCDSKSCGKTHISFFERSRKSHFLIISLVGIADSLESSHMITDRTFAYDTSTWMRNFERSKASKEGREEEDTGSDFLDEVLIEGCFIKVPGINGESISLEYNFSPE